MNQISHSNQGRNHGTQSDFQRWAIDYIPYILERLATKGKDYSESNIPALDNFITVGALLNMPPERYLLALASKHWYALCEWADGLRPEWTQENVHERTVDTIVYMLLLTFWSMDTPVPSPEEVTYPKMVPESDPTWAVFRDGLNGPRTVAVNLDALPAGTEDIPAYIAKVVAELLRT